MGCVSSDLVFFCIACAIMIDSHQILALKRYSYCKQSYFYFFFVPKALIVKLETAESKASNLDIEVSKNL